MFKCLCFTRYFSSVKRSSIFKKPESVSCLKCQISELHSTQNRASDRSSLISGTSGVRMEGGQGSKCPKQAQVWSGISVLGLPRRVSVSLLHIITAVPRVRCTRVYFCLETKEICFLCLCSARDQEYDIVCPLPPHSSFHCRSESAYMASSDRDVW